jgi:hypothetical protein
MERTLGRSMRRLEENMNMNLRNLAIKVQTELIFVRMRESGELF